MTEQRKAQLHVIVRGRVQGVGFRFFVERLANQRHLTGWVRNNPDGSVETVAEGPEEDLLSFLQALRQGPRAAFVTQCQETWSEYTGRFRDFRIVF